jgi:hypothetical protein
VQGSEAPGGPKTGGPYAAPVTRRRRGAGADPGGADELPLGKSFGKCRRLQFSLAEAPDRALKPAAGALDEIEEDVGVLPQGGEWTRCPSARSRFSSWRSRLGS